MKLKTCLVSWVEEEEAERTLLGSMSVDDDGSHWKNDIIRKETMSLFTLVLF
jgi:hypothetical protein